MVFTSFLWLLLGQQRRVIRVVETIGYRKTFMEETVRTAIEDGGCQQVLVIGGGFDTLALRLSAAYPLVHFWEVDHPATGRLKQHAVQEILLASSRPRTNIHLVPVDLAKTKLTSEILSQYHSYHHQDPTIVIIEGVLMYLTEQQVVDLLQHQVADIVGPKSVVAFDFVEGDQVDDATHANSNYVPSKSMWGPILTPILLWILRHLLQERERTEKVSYFKAFVVLPFFIILPNELKVARNVSACFRLVFLRLIKS